MTTVRLIMLNNQIRLPWIVRLDASVLARTDDEFRFVGIKFFLEDLNLGIQTEPVKNVELGIKLLNLKPEDKINIQLECKYCTFNIWNQLKVPGVVFTAQTGLYTHSNTIRVSGKLNSRHELHQCAPKYLLKK